jgi:hypothetical protein
MAEKTFDTEEEYHRGERKDRNIVMPKTIYQALCDKLGREPTNEEVKADVRRIMEEALVEVAQAGRLAHQRRRRR